MSSQHSTETNADRSQNSTTTPTLLPVRKRKDDRNYCTKSDDDRTKRRASYWDHFREYREKETDQLRAECKYCKDKFFACDPILNGSKNVKNHWDKCPANPENKLIGKQTELVFQTSQDDEREGTIRLYDFDSAEVRKALTYMIIVDELPFRFVQNEGFKKLMSVACPRFHVPSRFTVARDSYQLYLNEKQKLKELFVHPSFQRVSVTTDSWTSIQRINYMCLTAHFIDKNWKLNKNIINFCPISSHKGEAIGKAVEDCLIAWGLEDKLFTVTVDNATSNDKACSHLRKMTQRKGCVGDGKWIHMRCVAHIINLIVWDGLKTNEAKVTLHRVRGAVKFVRSSPKRIQMFKELAIRHKIECKQSLSLDVPTRWNSTYVMLETTVKYQQIFSTMSIPIDKELESSGNPTNDDWRSVEQLVIFLREFKTLTDVVSGSLYVTSNLSFFYIARALEGLNHHIHNRSGDFQGMATAMKEKYDKYWGNDDNMNFLIYMGAILDPKVKLKGVSLALKRIYARDEAEMLIDRVTKNGYNLFEEYYKLYAHLAPSSVQTTDMMDILVPSATAVEMFDFKKCIEDEVQMSWPDGGQSEFDRYLSDHLGQHERSLDVLQWWKLNEHKYPIVSCLARDVLALPMSTVASESAFSTGGRHLDKFRSLLTPKMVQSLICTQDWLRTKNKAKVNVEEILEELEVLEKDLEKLAPDDDVDELICVD